MPRDGVAAAVGVGVGLGGADGVGLGGALGLADGLALGVAGVNVRAGLADAEALGLGEASATAPGRIRMTTVLPLMSWSRIDCARRSRWPTPWSAVRNAVSCAMTSSAQAIRVVASGPIAAIVPFVVYGPS